MTEPIQILKAMKRRVEYEAQQLRALEDEAESLAAAHHRYEEVYDLVIKGSLAGQTGK